MRSILLSVFVMLVACGPAAKRPATTPSPETRAEPPAGAGNPTPPGPAVDPTPPVVVETPPPAVAEPPVASAPPTEVQPPVVPEGPTFRGIPIDKLLADMATRPVVKLIKKFKRAEPVYWLDLGEGLEVGFKPQTIARPALWRNDVAAWELSRLLGISDRVPPVTARALPLSILGGDYAKNPLLIPNGSKEVWGSVIFWMPVLEHSRLAMGGQKRWKRWLNLDRPMPPPEDLKLAAQTSTIIVLDYLQANSDRFEHPSNFMVDEHGDLVYRDNNEAWMSGPMGKLTYNRTYLDLNQRFSKSVIEALRKADRAALAAALEPWTVAGHPILDRLHLDWYEKRRVTLLKYVDALIRRHGEPAVLAFP